MIRRLVVGLVLVNIIFFALMQWGGKLAGEGKAPQQAALNADKIKLLNSPEAVPPVPPAVASVVPAVPAPATAVPLPPPAAPVVAAAPTPAPAPPAAPVRHAAEISCMEWSEFSGTDLARAEKALAGLKLGDKLGQRTVEYNRGYLVYLSPFKTLAGRNKKVRELKAAGISDYFVIKESGALKNAISVGVFKTEEAARHYQAELGKKGLKSVQVASREAQLKFIVFTFRQVDAATANQLGVWQKDYPGSELKTLPCGAANGK
ncbi:MAG TPA: SPOR domain-containing protein [Gallionellaceae bacterium]